MATTRIARTLVSFQTSINSSRTRTLNHYRLSPMLAELGMKESRLNWTKFTERPEDRSFLTGGPMQKGCHKSEVSKTLLILMLLIMICFMKLCWESNRWTILETLTFIGVVSRFSCRQWQLTIWGKGTMNSTLLLDRSGLMMRNSLSRIESSLERDFSRKTISLSWSNTQKEESLPLSEQESTRRSSTSM